MQHEHILTSNAYYQQLLELVKDPDERKRINDFTLEYFDKLLNAIGGALDTADKNIGEQVIITKENG